MALLGILVLVGLFAVGIMLIVLGARGLSHSPGWMGRALSILAIVLGAVFIVVLAGALIMHRAPWNALLIVLASGVVTAALIFWVSVLADCLLNEPGDGRGKLVWVLAIVLTLVVGAAIYYFGRRPRRLAETTK